MKFLSRLPGARTRPSNGTDIDCPAGHIARALTAAGLDGEKGDAGIRATIDRALQAAGLQPSGTVNASASASTASGYSTLSARRPASPQRMPGLQGEFLHATCANEHGRRDYRLYLPAGYDAGAAARPLLLMLHGCTQTAEDFATGTRMNALADRHGFLVAYPQQIGQANHARCWNWFRPEDQRGDAGEPSILAAIVQQIMQGHRIDAGRVFVAGLSAGAAMAVVLGQTRPDLVRAIGVHSGLPYASADDVPSALAAMQGRGKRRQAAAPRDAGVPMILFHGDADRTVVPRNADALAAAAVRPDQRSTTETGRAPGGQAYTRQTVVDGAGHPRLERWTVHGAGHAWSGGDPAGSYTDPAGPDASAAMIGFFLGLDRPPGAPE